MSPTATLDPVLCAPGAGEARWHHGSLMDWRLRAAESDGALALLEALIPAGAEPPIHAHDHEDELFVVLEGEVTFVCGGRELRGGPGTTAFLPRGVPHGFRVDTPTARMLVMLAPGAVEAFFRATSEPAPERVLPPPPEHVDAGAMVSALAGVGIAVVGPPPSSPEWGAAASA